MNSVGERGAAAAWIGLLLATALFVTTGGCASGVDWSDYGSRRAKAVLSERIREGRGYARIRAAEADPVPRPDFELRETTAPERFGELRVRIAGGNYDGVGEFHRAALDPAAPGHLHALESSAKLGLKYDPEERHQLWRQISRGSPGQYYALWLLAANGDPAAEKRLDLILAEREDGRATAAYAAGFLPDLPEARRRSLVTIMNTEPNSIAGVFAMWALARHGKISADEIVVSLKKHLRLQAEEKQIRFHLAALGEVGGEAELPALISFLDSAEPELVTAAAGAILQISSRLKDRVPER